MFVNPQSVHPMRRADMSVNNKERKKAMKLSNMSDTVSTNETTPIMTANLELAIELCAKKWNELYYLSDTLNRAKHDSDILFYQGMIKKKRSVACEWLEVITVITGREWYYDEVENKMIPNL